MSARKSLVLAESVKKHVWRYSSTGKSWKSQDFDRRAKTNFCLFGIIRQKLALSDHPMQSRCTVADASLKEMLAAKLRDVPCFRIQFDETTARQAQLIPYVCYPDTLRMKVADEISVLYSYRHEKHWGKYLWKSGELLFRARCDVVKMQGCVHRRCKGDGRHSKLCCCAHNVSCTRDCEHLLCYTQSAVGPPKKSRWGSLIPASI